MHIRIIIPECHINILTGYLHRLTRLCGGYMMWKGQGGWIDDSKEGDEAMCEEPITIVDCYWQSNFTAALQKMQLVSLCINIANDLDQESVYLSIDGKVQFVESTK